MAEQVKVFKNVVDQTVPVSATDVVLHTTSSTQRAVIKDLDCINLGINVDLDLDGRTLNKGTALGALERTKSLIMDTSSTLKLKFPAKTTTEFLGMFFFNGAEGINLVQGALDPEKPSITSVNNTSIQRGSGFVYKPLATDTPYFYALEQGNSIAYKHNIAGEVVGQVALTSGVYQMASDGTYIYYIKSATVVGRKRISDGVDSDVAVTNGVSMAMPGHNQGSYTIYYDGKVYSKNVGGLGNATVMTLSTGAVTLKNDGGFNVGSYSDGACVVVNTSGVPFIVEQGTSHYYYWNLNTDVLTRVSSTSQASTEYGNCACEVAPGIALILGEQTDRMMLINCNTTPPTKTQKIWPDNPYKLHSDNGTFGNYLAVAGGMVSVEQRKFSAYVAGIDITED
tara:strand:+ start:213 stop:1400 length:1188 start_codon:yes stop_codon:yes gene_type:complete